MLLLLSGEGASDIGAGCLVHQDRLCAPGKWTPGPMAYFADREFERHFQYSALDHHAWFASEKLLGRVGKGLAREKILLGPGKGHTLFRRNAQSLACLALALSAQLTNTPVIAVLFRDSDGTNSSPAHFWQKKRESIESGFSNFEFPSGVPMIPRPKSEAWLLCAIANAYQNCDTLEDAPGNDGSPRALKPLLDKAIPGGFNVSVLLEGIENGKIDLNRIDMPSLRAFRKCFGDAVAFAKSASWPPTIPAPFQRVVQSVCTAG